jgi:Vacuolar (H+)-ATPase G subunit
MGVSALGVTATIAGGGAGVEASILSALERAERDAQDRRLEAEAEAARLLHVARDRARVIEADADGRARAAVAALREDALAAARDQARAIDAADGTGHRPDEGPSTAGDRDEDGGRFLRAVELIVAAVLGESDPGTTARPTERGGPAGAAGPECEPSGIEAISC